MKKWTKTLAFAGQFIGMLLGTNQEYFYGLHGINDLAMLVGYGIPFAIIGLLFGLVVDYFLKPKEEKEMEHINNPLKRYEPNKTNEVKNKSLNSLKVNTNTNTSMEDAYSQVPIENKLNEKKIETSKLITKNIDEEKIWELVADEFDSDKRKKGLYAKLFAETGGDEVAIKAMYYKVRVKEFLNENSATKLEKETKINQEFASDEQCIINEWYVKEEIKGFTCFLLRNGKAVIDLEKKQIIYRNIDAVKNELAGYRVTGKFSMYGMMKEINKS